MDYTCAKFGNFSFSRFGFIMRTDTPTHTDRQTESQRRINAILTRLPLVCVICICCVHDRTEVNFIEAAAAGASNAISLVANIAANVIAFWALLRFLNSALTWFGQRVGIEQFTYQVTNYVIN